MAAKWNAEEEDVDYGVTTFADWTVAEYEGTLGFNSTGAFIVREPLIF